MSIRSRRQLLAAATGSLLLLAGCPSFSPLVLPQGERYSGRMSVRVENDAQRSFSAAFELAGTDREGVLSLTSPLGNQLARALWSPQRVELQTPQQSRQYASLEQLAVETLGEAVPIAALFDWLAGRPWRGAPSVARGAGFEQLGWQVDVAKLADGAIVATRPAAPEVVVRVRLDRSS